MLDSRVQLARISLKMFRKDGTRLDTGAVASSAPASFAPHVAASHASYRSTCQCEWWRDKDPWSEDGHVHHSQSGHECHSKDEEQFFATSKKVPQSNKQKASSVIQLDHSSFTRICQKISLKRFWSWRLHFANLLAVWDVSMTGLIEF